MTQLILNDEEFIDGQDGIRAMIASRKERLEAPADKSRPVMTPDEIEDRRAIIIHRVLAHVGLMETSLAIIKTDVDALDRLVVDMKFAREPAIVKKRGKSTLQKSSDTKNSTKKKKRRDRVHMADDPCTWPLAADDILG